MQSSNNSFSPVQSFSTPSILVVVQHVVSTTADYIRDAATRFSLTVRRIFQKFNIDVRNENEASDFVNLFVGPDD